MLIIGWVDNMCNYFILPDSLSNMKYDTWGKMCQQSSKLNYLLKLSVNVLCEVMGAR